MGRFVVLATGLFFLFYGIAFALAPLTMTALVTDDSPDTASAIIDLRATYGGLSCAVGVALLVLSARPAMLPMGLLLTATVLLAMAAGRLLGMLLDGNPNGLMVVYLVAELVFGALALILRKNTLQLTGA